MNNLNMEEQNCVKLEIQKLIESLETKSFDVLKSKLIDESVNIFIKEWDDSDLCMVTNNFSKSNNKLSDLERECRSIILCKKTLKIVCYTYDDIYYNQDAKDFIIKNNSYEKIIQECFEGTLITVFYHDDKWNLATRRCIDAKKSIWQNNKSYYDMFMECINIDFEDFTTYLNKNVNYFFVLVHHQNKHIVDYTEYFEDQEYKKIIHVMSRDNVSHLEIPFTDNSQWLKEPIFFKTPKNINDDTEYFEMEESKAIVDYINSENELELNSISNMKNFSKLDNLNKNNKLDLPVKSEGLIVKVRVPEVNKTVLLKFQTNSYQFMSMLKPNTNNIFMSFIELYQNDMLKRHLEYFPGNSKFDSSSDEIYDTIGVVDAVFKVQTSELFELFRTLYNLRDCSHKNEDLYNILPTEYTIALYRIRGIYYKKKEKYIKSKQDVEVAADPQTHVNTGLRIFDIYNMLKYNYETKDLLKLLRSRKLLINSCLEKQDENSKKILNLSHRCDKVSIKMMAILLNKMFPKDKELDVYSKKTAKEEYSSSENLLKLNESA